MVKILFILILIDYIVNEKNGIKENLMYLEKYQNTFSENILIQKIKNINLKELIAV